MANKVDKILGEYREKDSGKISQYDTDPASPSAEDVWVLKAAPAVAGGGAVIGFIGLGVPLLLPGTFTSITYRLSFRTKEGTTKRATLS
jgi:hypothetical protein